MVLLWLISVCIWHVGVATKQAHKLSAKRRACRRLVTELRAKHRSCSHWLLIAGPLFCAISSRERDKHCCFRPLHCSLIGSESLAALVDAEQMVQQDTPCNRDTAPTGRCRERSACLFVHPACHCAQAAAHQRTRTPYVPSALERHPPINYMLPRMNSYDEPTLATVDSDSCPRQLAAIDARSDIELGC